MSDSEERRGINWTVTYFLLLAISVGFLLAGYFVGRQTVWTHLLNEFGVAGIVAFVLALTIERLSANEFKARAESERDLLRQEFRELAEKERAAIKKDVFYQAYGRMIPQEIREELDHHVLQADFIRSDLYLQFDLTIEMDPQTSQQYVKSRCLTRSKIKNLSGKARAFPIEHSIDASPSDALSGEVRYLEFQSSGSEHELSLKEPDLKTMTRNEGGQISLDLSKAQQVIVLPDHPTSLRIQYQGIRVLEGGGIYFSFTSHTCDLELTVHVKNRDLDVVAEAYSPHPLAETERHDPGNGYYNWTIKKPLLSYQAIRVTWHRASARTPQGLALGNRVPEAPSASSPTNGPSFQPDLPDSRH
jgi:hypothetical protein